jgi:hypothetical protein
VPANAAIPRACPGCRNPHKSLQPVWETPIFRDPVGVMNLSSAPRKRYRAYRPIYISVGLSYMQGGRPYTSSIYIWPNCEGWRGMAREGWMTISTPLGCVGLFEIDPTPPYTLSSSPDPSVFACLHPPPPNPTPPAMITDIRGTRQPTASALETQTSPQPPQPYTQPYTSGEEPRGRLLGPRGSLQGPRDGEGWISIRTPPPLFSGPFRIGLTAGSLLHARHPA